MAFSIADRKSNLWSGYLSDPDDYLYLIQATDWLKGQDWYDAVQHRLNPPDGTYIHFSHLLSAFYAGFIAVLQPFFGSMKAEWLTALITPPLFLGVFLKVVKKLGQTTVNHGWGDLAACLVFFFPGLLFQFRLGHLDHHGLEALIATAAFYNITRITENNRAQWSAASAGFLLALALYIGLESLPIVALLCLCLGIFVTVEEGNAPRSGLTFSLSLFLSSAGFLLITRPPSLLLDFDIEAYSAVYVLLCAGIAICFIGVACARRIHSLKLRIVIGIALVISTSFAFLYFFPSLIAGPYGKMDPALATLIFNAETESWPLVHLNTPWEKSYVCMIEPLLAMAVALHLFFKTKRRHQKWIWSINFLVVTVCFGLTLFYQRRCFSYVAPFAVLPLTYLLREDWIHPPEAISWKEKFRLVRILCLLLVGPASILIMGNFGEEFGDADAAQMSLEADNQASNKVSGCNMLALADALNDPTTLGSRPRIILSSLNEGIDILYRTKHLVLAGPYHEDTTGNLDTLAFFNATEDATAKAIMEHRQGDLVVICDVPSQLIAYNLGKDETNPQKASLISKLIHHEAPDWLKEIDVPAFGQLLLFERR